MSLGKKVFAGATLLFIRKVWGNVINLMVMAFLARLLTKEDFGLLAISSIFLSIINTLATSGIAEYVVYYDGEDKDQKLNAAFWLNLFLTIAVIAVVAVTGPWWAIFYENEKIYGLLILLSVAFFFEMGSTIPKAMLRKELEYKTLVFYSSVSMTAVSIGKIIAAFAGMGVYSLVIPQALVSPFLMVSFFIKTGWRPDATLGLSHFKAIFNYSRHIIGGRVLTKIVNEGDNLIVGKFIGLEGLGIYALAFQLANLVTANVVFLVNDLFLPLFSKVKGDVGKLRELYLKMIQFLSFISFPLITLLIIVADPIVYFVYGEGWLDVVLPLQIMCVFALGRSISSPSSSLFSAVGRPDIGFKFTAYFTPIFLLAVFVGSKYGVIGVALATSFIRVCGSVVSLNLSLSLIQLTLTDLYRTIRSNLSITLLLIVIIFSVLLGIGDSKRMYLVGAAPCILYFYFLLLRILFPLDLRSFFRELERYIPIKSVHKVIQGIFFFKTEFEIK